MTIQIVLAALDDAEQLLALLDGTERDRAAAFVDAAARARFVSSHGLLRLLAAERLGVQAMDVELRQRCVDCGGPHGRPEIDGLQVSLSRSGNLVAVAIGTGAALGIDVEHTQGVRFKEFDDIALTDAERRALAGVRPVHRDEQRARWWTRKEALLKAYGTGLRVDARLVPVLERHEGLADVPAPDGYVCSVAVCAGAVGQVRLSAAPAGWAVTAAAASG